MSKAKAGYRSGYVLVAALLMSTSAFAASCGNSPMSSADVSRFLQNPQELMAPVDPQAGAGALVNRIRNFLLAAPDSVESLAPLLRVATGDQANALGVGLGAAAQICVQKNPQGAQKIQLAVLESNNNDVSKAFSSVTGDQPVYALSNSGTGFPLVLGSGGGQTSRGSIRPIDATIGGFQPYNPGSGNTSNTFSASASSSSRSSGNALRSVSGSR